MNKKIFYFIFMLTLILWISPNSYALIDTENNLEAEHLYKYSVDNPMSSELKEQIMSLPDDERMLWIEKNVEPVYVGTYKTTKTSRGEWLETNLHSNAVYRDPANNIPIFQLNTRAKFLVDTSQNLAQDATTLLFSVNKYTNVSVITSATNLVRWSPSNLAKTYTAEGVDALGYYLINQQYNFYGHGSYAVRVY